MRQKNNYIREKKGNNVKDCQLFIYRHITDPLEEHQAFVRWWNCIVLRKHSCASCSIGDAMPGWQIVHRCNVYSICSYKGQVYIFAISSIVWSIPKITLYHPQGRAREFRTEIFSFFFFLKRDNFIFRTKEDKYNVHVPHLMRVSLNFNWLYASRMKTTYLRWLQRSVKSPLVSKGFSKALNIIITFDIKKLAKVTVQHTKFCLEHTRYQCIILNLNAHPGVRSKRQFLFTNQHVILLC